MELSRRDALKVGAFGAAAAAGVVGVGNAWAADPRHVGGHPGEHTTLNRTLLLGQPGAGGYRPIVPGPGEPHLLRDELIPPSLRSGRRRRGRPLLAFGQLTDIHAMDAQSPARVEFLDRYNDPDSPLAGLLPFDSAYRAYEFLSAQISDSMVRAINQVRRSRVHEAVTASKSLSASAACAGWASSALASRVHTAGSIHPGRSIPSYDGAHHARRTTSVVHVFLRPEVLGCRP